MIQRGERGAQSIVPKCKVLKIFTASQAEHFILAYITQTLWVELLETTHLSHVQLLKRVPKVSLLHLPFIDINKSLKLAASIND